MTPRDFARWAAVVIIGLPVCVAGLAVYAWVVL